MGQSCSAQKPSDFNLSGASPEQPSAAKPQGRLPEVWQRSAKGEAFGEVIEPPLPIHIATFSMRRRKRSAVTAGEFGTTASIYPAATGVGDTWKRWYALGRELGRGISATVFEAEAFAKTSSSAEKPSVFSGHGFCGSSFVPGCIPEKGRRVAVKRFKKVGSRSFNTELANLLRCGTHPNVLRLLESYEDCDGEDALILEYCDGCTVFDAYAQARKNGDFLPELLVARLIRQLLLALEHIICCGVDHQDVKPENMLLYSFSLQEQRAELKLADFGWATAKFALTPGGMSVATEPPPAEGAGSLWYAPPELNPPVQALNGASPVSTLSVPRLAGRSDMWSVGVVVYLMLVGHNPFNGALRHKSQKAMEHEVIEQAAKGQFDMSSPRWLQLPQDARDFILGMIVVAPGRRLSASEALRHPYLVRRLARCSEALPLEPSWHWADREDAWCQLDGFQRLAWAAISRSIAEPELSRETVASASRAMRASANGRGGTAEYAYIWHLARELCVASVSTWLVDNSAWSEVLRLAFRYLDSDDDGILSPKDMVTHLVILGTDTAAHADAWSAAHLWVSRWCNHGEATTPRSSGLSPAHFRAAVLSSHEVLQSSARLGQGIDHTSDLEGDADFSMQGVGSSILPEEELCGWKDVWSRGIKPHGM